MSRSVVIDNHPETVAYFNQLDELHRSIDGDNLQDRWRKASQDIGIDFDGWIDQFDWLLATVDIEIYERLKAGNLPAGDYWEPVHTTKQARERVAY